MHFDLVTYFQWAADFLAGSGGVWAITQVVKKSQSVSWIAQGDTTKLRAIAGLLSAVAVVMMNLANNHSLDVSSLQSIMVDLAELGVIWGGAHSIHAVTNPSA